jgi:hypothetical protein
MRQSFSWRAVAAGPRKAVRRDGHAGPEYVKPKDEKMSRSIFEGYVPSCKGK